ncbi:MAG: T9SS type A sorting domain-containing protein, partial [Bacteroidota bacterium]
GHVYLVLGSDTGIWDGMDVADYSCTYNLSLFTDPTRNAAQVMDPSFRLALKDSYGTPVKLTWWMMQGNIFRHATNTNVPDPNTMTLYLMKRYQGTAVRMWGDELSLHYHTFVWTDYDGDGKYYWNQAHEFSESSDDFDVTVAGMLLEEETFPVSFRSGWHAMDNVWQQRLDSLLPYSLHNDWPAKRVDTTEPLDNTYDWSRASSLFVPFHPSPDDYQVPGSCRGWNVRSKYMSAADSAFMDGIFRLAAKGTDEVVCLWAHLPETDFLDNVRKVDASAHKAATRYPTVKFRYCTAVEAMQRWRKTVDTVQPQITFHEISEGTTVRWAIACDEALFQSAPFVATKDIYGTYHVLSCTSTGDRSWETTIAVSRADLAKAGVAATDTAGNLATAFIRYRPEDIIIDDVDPGYAEQSGAWGSSQSAAWGTTSRTATLGSADSAKTAWSTSIPVSGLYNVYAQVPAVSGAAHDVEFRLEEGSEVVSSTKYTSGIPANRWVYLGTRLFTSGTSASVVMVAQGATQAGSQIAADVVKFSALVREQWLVVPDVFGSGDLIVQDESARRFTVRNEGIQPVTISSVTSTQGTTSLQSALPITVPSMGETQLDVVVRPTVVGPLRDTLVIVSDDPRHSRALMPVQGNVVEYFAIVDDRDSLSFAESGAWSFSVAKAYGTTSRYAYPAPGVSATFHVILQKTGVYQIQEIVPTTVNASVRSRYVLSVDGVRLDSAFIDQNAGSGSWVTIMEHDVAGGSEARVELTDAMSPVISGKVLRADAVRFQWVNDKSSHVREDDRRVPAEASLGQNYPNPFNPTTVIRGQWTGDSRVKLTVYDVLGREVAVLANGRYPAGRFAFSFNANGLASGVYYYRLQAGSFVETRTMVLMK